MATFDLHVVVARLDPALRQALEQAVGLAVAREHGSVEVEHWLLALVEGCRPFGEVLREFDCPAVTVAAEVTHALDRMRRGSSGAPSLAQATIGWIEEAWLTASLRFGRDSVAAADLVAALTTSTALRATIRDVAPSLRLDSGRAIQLAGAVAAAPRAAAGGGAPGGGAKPGAGASGEIDNYTVDLTADARAGKLDPVVGREAELRQVIDVLLRRRQNNPILTGEAGVGKTAVVEALALCIAEGAVPAPLRDVTVRALDLGLLQAGAGVKGEFERRLTAVIAECRTAASPVILFIDEAHTLIGAGNQAGGSDAANLLKPALARGELRAIAATTWSEYKRHIERDPALTRRFQVVKVEEPGEANAARMLRGLVPALEAHHGVVIRDAAVAEAVRLSARYLPARQLPDKAVSVLDTAAASVAISRSSDPAALQDLMAEARYLAVEQAALARDDAGAAPEAASAPLSALEARIAQTRDDLGAVRDRLGRERALIEAIDALDRPEESGRPEVRQRRAALAAELAVLQGEAPLVHREVDREAVAAVIARWTGIPVGRLMRDAVAASQSLEDRLRRRVTGQDAALGTIAAAIRTATAGLADPRKPPGVFLMVGTSGVGKTETALALAEALHGGEASLSVVNMSEFKEEHKVSSLVGAPPGYVGYGEGGVLTEAVRRRPYGILLLDEVEKAHPNVQDVFYQVFDKGSLRDGEGRDVDFKNTTIILTANAGSDTLAALAADPDTMPEGEALVEAIRPELLRHFKPAFLGRVTIVPYLPLSPDILARIARLQLERVRERVSGAHAVRLDWDPEVEARVVARCLAADIGARAIEGVLTREILPALSDLILGHALDGRVPGSVTLSVSPDGRFLAGTGETAGATAGASGPAVAKPPAASS